MGEAASHAAVRATEGAAPRRDQGAGSPRASASPGRRQQPGTGGNPPVPGWHAWRSDAGRWWATRTGRRARYENGVPMTIDADSETELRELCDGYREEAAR